MKKILAIVLALVLCMSMMVTASAETELKIYLFGQAQNMDKVLEKFYAESGLDIKLNTCGTPALITAKSCPCSSATKKTAI